MVTFYVQIRNRTLPNRFWHALAIAACFCLPVWPLVLGGETLVRRHHHHAYVASTPTSPRWWKS